MKRTRSASRGLSLIEILVVMAIIAIVTTVAVGGTMLTASAKLRRSAATITSAIKVAYTRATSTSRDIRLVMDFDRSAIWLEESDRPMLVRMKDTSGTGGAAAVTNAENEALAEGDKIVKGPAIPKPRFRPIEAFGFGDVEGGKGGKALQTGITFRSVQSAHDDAPRTSGRAYLYFWPGGRTERSSIQIRVGDSDEDAQTLSLVVSPLTGKVVSKPGPAELQLPTDDAKASDREDTGF